MLVEVRYEAKSWLIDENSANIFPCLRAVVEDESLGASAMAVIALGVDSTSKLAEIFIDEDERLKEAFISVFGNDDKLPAFLKNKKIIAAVSDYRIKQNTREAKLRGQYEQATEALGDFIEKKSEKLNDDNIKGFMDAMAKFPDHLKQYSSMKKEKQSDQAQTKAIIKGGRTLTKAEQKKKK